jgi:DNA-binding LacI/PurR family transcriptional regulator
VSTPKAVRLQDIAERAGVSRATVSLALRHHASIPAATCARIQQIADEMGYRPNPLVSALMSHQRASQRQRRTDVTLGMILDFSQRGGWQNYVSEDLLSRAAAQAEHLGYRLENFWLKDLKCSSDRLGGILSGRGIPGVIMAPLSEADGRFFLPWEGFSAVTVGYSMLQPRLHRVTSNRFTAMRTAIRHLREQGYRRLGLAMSFDQDARVEHLWSAAFVWEQTQLPAAARTVPFVMPERQWTKQHFARWLKANRPEVIFGFSPILEWLHELGVAVPDEVGFAHLWNPDESGEFAGIFHDPPAIGAAAVDFLVGMLHRNERGVPNAPQSLLLEAGWRDGKTVRARP